MTVIDTINTYIISFAGSPWVLLVVFVVAVIDGFFPPIPSETLVVGAASVFSSTHQWYLAAVLAVVAALGAMCGDLVAYTLGRKFNAGQWKFFSRGKGAKAFTWAERTFARGGGPLVIVARYIPVGRVAVNLTAGSIRFPLKRFLIFDGVAALTWGIYSTAVGYAAGQVVGENPLLGVVVGILFAVSLGSLVQYVVNKRLGPDHPEDRHPHPLPPELPAAPPLADDAGH
jgi:membrane protein DedA with SNARE-associated domain